jgi:hypothetical protein
MALLNYRRPYVEQRTARLTLLIDPKKKSVFEKLCAEEDVTASQKVRQFIREYIEQQLGADWQKQVLDEQEDGQI